MLLVVNSAVEKEMLTIFNTAAVTQRRFSDVFMK